MKYICFGFIFRQKNKNKKLIVKITCDGIDFSLHFYCLKINPKYSFHFMFFTNYFLQVLSYQDYSLQTAKRIAENLQETWDEVNHSLFVLNKVLILMLRIKPQMLPN